MKPLFMYAGGKTKLLKHYRPIFENLPDSGTYVEPFFGGGAVFSVLGAHKRSFVNDVNTELMGIYEAVRDNPDVFIAECTRGAQRVLRSKDRKATYYEMRSEYWESPTPEKLYVLMRCSFNGVWQTCRDSHGLFGTPAGLLTQSRPDQIVDSALIHEWSALLGNAVITSTDFENVPVPDGSVVYLDPPYRGSFTTYGKKFGDDEQMRVVEWAKKMSMTSTVLFANRDNWDNFFENLLGDVDADFHYFDVVYTAGRRKQVDGGYEALPAREFLAVL